MWHIYIYIPIDSLTNVSVQLEELGGHVGESGQTIRVQVLVAHARHVELYYAYDDEYEQASEADLRQRTLRVPI